MARDTVQLAAKLETAKAGGLLTGFLAEERAFDRRLKLRLAIWGLAAVGAVGAAMVAGQQPMTSQRDLLDDLARQSEQIQSLTRESQNETRRLASAIDTLNGDRDRLYSRVSILEQSLDAMPDKMARQNSAAALPAAPTSQQTSNAQSVEPARAASATTAKSANGSTALQTPAPVLAQAAASSAAVTQPPSPWPSSAPAQLVSTAAKSAPSTLARQSSAAELPQLTSSASLTSEPSSAPQNPGPAPQVSPVATTAARSAKGTMARQGSGTASPQVTASASPAVEPPSESQNATGTSSPVSPMASMAFKGPEKPPAEPAAKAADQGPSALPSGPEGPAKPSATPPTPPPLMASPSLMAPPDAAAAKLVEPEKPPEDGAAATPQVASSASTEPEPSQTTSSRSSVKRTEFAVDVGGASSVSGLRAMWRGLLKSNSALAKLDPIIVVKEGSGGLGMQLRLVAGPLDDAAAAAKICAALTESERTCEPTIFDGQRLAMKSEEQPPLEAKVPATKPATHRWSSYRRGQSQKNQNDESSKKPESSALSSFFGRR